MSFEIDIGYVSLQGKRDINEDFCAAMLPGPGQSGMGAICAIADGVSAGGAGHEAAQTTVTSLVRDYYGTPPTWETTVALDRIISAQNTWLAAINRRRQPTLGLCTLTAMVLRGHSYALAHVGDTRAYLLREGRLTQLSHDHVVDHPDMRSQLLRSVGAEDRVVVDYSEGDLQVGDVFILTSDGVHGVLSPKHFLAAAVDANAQQLSERLTQAAIERGSQDNASALVVRVLGVSEMTLHDEQRSAAQLPIPPRLKVGQRIDGLLVTAVVFDSGASLLYQVRDTKTQKLYALKTLHPARARDAQERAMLAHEAWLAKRMQNASAAHYLVPLYDAADLVEQPSSYYLLYDWCNGETLQQLLDKGERFGAAQASALTLQAAQALARLHRQRVIHRDIKPANLLRGDDGVLRVLDLGVALSGSEPKSLRELHAGTPSYINPEQWGFDAQTGSMDSEREAADAQSDLFALGVTLYQLLTSKLPYGEVLPYQAGRYYRDPVAPSRHNPEVPIWLDHVALKAVARDKRQRFETAEEFVLALERGASRPLTAPAPTPLIARDPAALWKIALGISLLFNLLLVYWLIALPK
jgi:serine/threonine protein phosphatase PrpC